MSVLTVIELETAAGELGDSALSAQELPLTERTDALMISRLPVLTRSLILIAAFDDAASLGEVTGWPQPHCRSLRMRSRR